MIRSPIRRRPKDAPPRRDRSAEFASFELPKATARMATNLGAEPPRPDPVAETFRSEAWRRAVATLPCAHCRVEGRTQAAHANHRDKGMGLKAPDCLTFPLCDVCHREFDQGTTYTKSQRRELADGWIIETITELARRGLIRA